MSARDKYFLRDVEDARVNIALSNIFLRESYDRKYLVLDESYNNNLDLGKRTTNYLILIEIKCVSSYSLSNNSSIY